MLKTIFFLIIFSLLIITAKAEKSIIVQSTTSLKNSGFYNYILPSIKEDLKINANVVALGSGAAIRNAMLCNGDLLIVHSPEQENNLIMKGYAEKAHYVMHNYFILVGPNSDPANVINTKKTKNVFKKIFYSKSFFISRGDNSGTHEKEKKIWNQAQLNPSMFSGQWYLETGTNMGATINTAVGLSAYTLADMATWITFANKQDFKVYVKQDKNLINQYKALIIKKSKCPLTKEKESDLIVKWLLSNKAKEKIINFKKNNQQLFFIK